MYLAFVEEAVSLRVQRSTTCSYLLNLVANVVPSVNVAMTKLYRLSLPFHHKSIEMSTLQIFLVVPKSARIHESSWIGPCVGF